jgi:excisionase family DNA binding protein
MENMKPNPTIAALSYRPEQVSQMTGLSRTKIFALVADGTLESKRVGKARLILARSVERFIEGGE